jgi:hypothetical protein
MTRPRRRELIEESELGTFAVHRGGMTLALGGGAWITGALGLMTGVIWLRIPVGTLLCFLAPFVALGAGWIVAGARVVAQERYQRRSLADDPGQPWLADYPWQPPVISDRAGAQLVPLLARLAMGLGCGVPLTLGLWIIEEERAAIVLALLTVAAASIGVAYIGRRAMRWVHQGTSRLELTSFPVAPGEDLHAMYRPGRRLEVPDNLRIRLRFVAEEHELRKGLGRVPDVEVVCYLLYETKQEHPVTGGAVDPETGISLAISIPPEALDRGWVTCLSQRPAQYWQLIIEGSEHGADLRSVFFLPIYAPATLS